MTDRTVREGGNRATAGRTTREGSSAGGTVREQAGSRTLREDGGLPMREGSPGRAWLPAALASRFEVVEELPTRGMEADLLIIASENGSRFVAKIYRRGIKPNEEILRILKQAKLEHVVRLEEFGEEDGIYWELIEYIEHSSMRALIDHEGPKLPDATVRQILKELNDALTHLHGLPIEHRDLKPDNVLVRTRMPIDLVLADFGIASLMDASVRETSAHRTISYAPPEAIGVFTDEDDGSRRNVAVVRTRWDYWSLGMILVEMLAGEHPFKGRSEAVIAHRLATQNVDDIVEGIEKEGWRKLCRGLLRRDPLKRWGSEQVALWLANERDPRLTVEDEIEPTEFKLPPIPYYGELCPSPKELLIHLRKDWDKAKAYFASGTNLNKLVEWLRFELGMEDLADAIKGTDTDTTLKTIEGRTFSYIQTIAKFTGDNQVEYKGRELTSETIKKTAEAAAKGDRTSRAQLLDLYENGIVIVAGKFERESGLSKIASNWRDAVNDYKSKVQDIIHTGARAPALEGDTLVKLLAASLPVSSVVSELRSAAQRATTTDARECSWFRKLGDPDKAKASVGAIMIIPHVIREAEAGARQRRYDAVIEKFGTPARFMLGAAGGLVGGIVTAHVPGLVVYWPVRWIWGEQVALTFSVIWIVGLSIVAAFIRWIDLTRLVGNRSHDHDQVRFTGIMYSIIGATVIVAVLLWGFPEIRSEYQRFAREEAELFALEQRMVDSFTADSFTADQFMAYQGQSNAGNTSTAFSSRGGEITVKCPEPKSTIILQFRCRIFHSDVNYVSYDPDPGQTTRLIPPEEGFRTGEWRMELSVLQRQSSTSTYGTWRIIGTATFQVNPHSPLLVENEKKESSPPPRRATASCGESVYLTLVSKKKWLSVSGEPGCDFKWERSPEGGIVLVRLNQDNATIKEWASSTNTYYEIPSHTVEFKLKSGDPVQVTVSFVQN